VQAFDILLSHTPLWVIGLSIALIFVASTECGYRLHGWWRRRTNATIEKSDGGIHILGGALGLLALILGFSFSMALDRYDKRRDLVLQEANAIGTVYQRVQILDQPGQGQLSILLKDYVDVRLEYFAAADDVAKQEAAWTHTENLQDQLWRTMTDAVRPILDTPLSGLVIQSMNEATDLANARRAAFGSHIPISVLVMVVAYALISAGILGYVLFDSGRRHLVTSTLLTVLLSMVITLVIDVDRPRAGTVVVSVAPLLELQKSIAGQSTAANATSALPADISYICANQKTLRVAFAENFETATLFVADEKVALTQAIAASGIRYVGGEYEFWSKGDEAFLQRGGQTIVPDCRKR